MKTHPILYLLDFLDSPSDTAIVKVAFVFHVHDYWLSPGALKINTF